MLKFSDLTYAGAFYLPKSVEGGNTGPNRGGIEIKKGAGKGLAQGYINNQSGAGWYEFNIPELDPTVTDQLPRATVSQNFCEVESKVDKHGERRDRMIHAYYTDGGIAFNMVQQYDASGQNKHFLGRIKNADDIVNSEVDGLFPVEGEYKAAGWMNRLPEKWANEFGFTHYMGHAHNFSIVRRTSVGPSMYLFNGDDLMSRDLSAGVSTKMVLGYPHALGKGLHATKYPDMVQKYGYGSFLYNRIPVDDPTKAGPDTLSYDQIQELPNKDELGPLGNDICTMLSRIGVGFVKDDTYVVIGTTAGVDYGCQYRSIDSDGTYSSGPIAMDANDHHQFYWLYDMHDIAKVYRGEIEPWDVVPYEYGKYEPPVPINTNGKFTGEVVSGSYDDIEGKVYISIRAQDGNMPLIVVYNVGEGVLTPVPTPTDPVKDALSDVYTALDKLKSLIT